MDISKFVDSLTPAEQSGLARELRLRVAEQLGESAQEYVRRNFLAKNIKEVLNCFQLKSPPEMRLNKAVSYVANNFPVDGHQAYRIVSYIKDNC